MENATKALLIAAAILIAIILISLGIAVVQSGSNALEQADLSDTEKQAFNMKFQNHEATKASVQDVNNLLSTVLSHNMDQSSKGTTNQITVNLDGKSYLANTATSYNKQTGSGTYKIQCSLSTTTGLVNVINITKNK